MKWFTLDTLPQWYEIVTAELVTGEIKEVRFVKTDDFPPTWKGVKC